MNKTPALEIVEKGLAIKAPWKIDEIKFKPSENNEHKQNLHVFLSLMQGAKFNDSAGTPCPIHSNTYEKTWRHSDFEEQRCYIHCKIPSIKTTAGTIQTVEIPWARKNSRFSLSFETLVLQLIKDGLSLSMIEKLLKEDSLRLWTILNGWVSAAYSINVVDKEISVIGIDEISNQANDKQITVIIDLKNERILRVTQGIGKNPLQDAHTYLENKGISSQQIKHICGPLLTDISGDSSFIKNVTKFFPQAEYHIDRLYIVELLNNAMNQISKKEKQRTKKLAEERALLTKNPTTLSAEQKIIVQELSTKFPNIGHAYQLKNEFFALWDQSSLQAVDTFLESWCQQVNKTNLSPLKQASQQIKAHKKHLIRFSELPTESNKMEKIHKNILAATKRTKGLKNFENVSNMILFCCGKLTFPHTQS